ncbi:MAG: N-acetylmuramoyl-L-alanine amidase [Clostridiales bacterium]|nr:N-acetylmuramoyl-L-alanine amidase [Clostridiales bacterium]
MAERKIVCLDPGHGPGCVNGSPDGSYREYEFAWDMGQRVRRLLEQRGVKVVMTKTESEYPSLTTRANVSNRAGADLFLSLHSNATGAKGWSVTRGLIVYTSMAGASAGRNIAANCVIKRMREAGVVVQGSGLQHNKSYTVLAKTNAPAMIVEYGFHTNAEDVRLLKSDAHRDKLATATAKGVCDYLGVEWETGSGLDADVDALASAGIITSPDYWKAGNYSAANVQALIRAMANYIRKDNAL